MIEFRGPFDRSKNVSEPGTRYYTEYTGKFAENGEIELVDTGKHDIYNEIQSYADSCTIQNILRRFEMGETDVLSKMQGAYVDLTNFPKSYAEMLQLMNDSQMYFDQLPFEVREMFGFDINKFMASFGTEDFYAKINAVLKPKEEEVKFSEQAIQQQEAAEVKE